MTATNTAQYSKRVDEALTLVADAFRNHIRKGSRTPYLFHLLQVATWVGEYGGSEDQMIAALLHDYLEDIEGATESFLTDRFGEHVTSLVVALSDSTTYPKDPWLPRKERYVRSLSQATAEIKLISVCDKLHNAETIVRDLPSLGDVVWQRFTATPEQSLWYYRAVTKALARDFSHPLLDKLKECVIAMHALAGEQLSSF